MTNNLLSKARHDNRTTFYQVDDFSKTGEKVCGTRENVLRYERSVALVIFNLRLVTDTPDFAERQIAVRRITGTRYFYRRFSCSGNPQ